MKTLRLKRMAAIAACGLVIAACAPAPSMAGLLHLHGPAAYPPGVLAADADQGHTGLMQTIYNYRSGIGVGTRVPRGSMTLNAPSGGWPSGAVRHTFPVGTGDPHASIDVTTGANISVSSVDVNAGIYITGAGPIFNVTDSWLSNPAGSFLSTVGISSASGGTVASTATFVGNFLTVDGTGVSNTHAAPIENGDTSATTNSQTWNNTLFTNLPGDIIVFNGPLFINNSFLGSFAQNPSGTGGGGPYPTGCTGQGGIAHVEPVKINNGAALIFQSLVDPSVAPLDFCRAGINAPLFVDPSGGGFVDQSSVTHLVWGDSGGNVQRGIGADVVVTISYSEYFGSAFLNNAEALVNTKCAAGYDGTAIFDHSVLEKGHASYTTNFNLGYIGSTTSSGAFNVGDTVQDGASGLKAKIFAFNAVGAASTSGATNGTAIPQGAVLIRGSDSKQFTVVAATTVSGAAATVSLQADVTGAASVLVNGDSLTLKNAISGVPNAFTVGSGGGAFLTLQPFVSQAAPWGGSFTNGDTLNDLATGATMLIGTSLLNTCQGVAGVGNFDKVTGAAISVGVLN